MSKHTYADSTLKSWTKDELIHQIRILERNLAVKQELVDNQAKLLETWAPVVHGHWISEDIGYGVTRYRCSRCGVIIGESEIAHFGHNKYCSMCGAKMGGRD